MFIELQDMTSGDRWFVQPEFIEGVEGGVNPKETTLYLKSGDKVTVEGEFIEIKIRLSSIIQHRETLMSRWRN